MARDLLVWVRSAKSLCLGEHPGEYAERGFQTRVPTASLGAVLSGDASLLVIIE